VKGLAAEGQQALAKSLETAQAGFVEAMDDDLNTSGGLAAIFDLVRAVNQARADGATEAELAGAQALVRELTGVMGLRLRMSDSDKPQAAAPFIDLLLEIRAEMRKQKLWAVSDQIRDRLAKLGVVLEDSKDGTSWRLE
jgi:cysteinyl-tRNA synthetase